ncbi:caldesmon isoform X2 [Anguilla anguilla]|uniref:caldesmon isoform X2 n=1 Tax=Anguilla anguilla TaxID=7936 RepID=UPI0015A8767D|nr:caldesmon isoform X2 [Anguilla anguilla]
MAARKRSVVWSFFQDDLSSKSAACILCAENIQHCGNTTNMLKHLRSKHQEELTNTTRRRRFGDVTRGPMSQLEPKQTDDITENAEMHMSEMDDQQTEQEPLEGNEEMGRAISDGFNGALALSVTKNRKRSAVWRYYQDGFDKNKVLCLVCSENIHYPQNTSNLLRHLRKKHPGEYGDIEGCLKERSGERARALAGRAPHNSVADNEEVIQVSIITGEPEEQERISSEEASRAVSDIVEEAFSLSVQPSKKRSAVWSYYERGEDANKVLCLLCSENIHYRQNTSNLLRHLRKKHPEKNVDMKRRGPSAGGPRAAAADRAFPQHALPSDYRSLGACPPGFVAPITLEESERMRRTLEQSEQMRRTLEQETRALERERELTEQLRRAQQQEARALEQQRELTEHLRRAQEEEMKRVRELEARALEQERQAVERLRRTQEQEAMAIEREREALEQLRRELEEDRKALQRDWDAARQGRVPMVGGEIRQENQALPGMEGGEVEMLVVTT